MSNNKDFVYERDYHEIREFIKEQTDSNERKDVFKLAHDSGVFKAIDDRIRELPHMINPNAKKAFDDCLVMLEEYAANFGGRIRGIVSYEIFDAYIYLDLPFHEFTPDRIDDLKFIANHARSVCFTSTEDNQIRLSVRFSYFQKIGEADVIIEEELKKRPELCERLEAIKDDEVHQILSNPWLVAMIEPQADNLGMSVEEYVRSIQMMIDEQPEKFMKVLKQQLKDRHRKLSHEE